MQKTTKPSSLGLLGRTAVMLGLQAVRGRRDAPERRAGAAGRGGTAPGGGGERAASPTDLSTGGWTAVLKRVFAEISSDHVLLVAAGVTFYALLALFPALAATVSIYGLFADPATIQDHIAGLEGVLPGGAVAVISDQLETLTSQGSAGLGLTFAIGLATSLWSANAGMKAIFEALNIAYEEQESRGFVRLTLVSLLFTLGALLFVVVAIGAVIVVPAVLATLALGEVAEPLIRWLRWPILLVIVAGLIALLYRFGPSRAPAEWRWVSWGSGAAALLWVVLSVLFSWYAANFGSYNATYGSLGAVIGFMTWVWLSATVIIVGAELNSELEHQTARDTTTGPDRPLGRRGAVMADRVAGGPDRAKGRGDGL